MTQALKIRALYMLRYLFFKDIFFISKDQSSVSHLRGKQIVICYTSLTQNPAKNLTMFQIPKFNFKISLVLISMLWYPAQWREGLKNSQ